MTKRELFQSAANQMDQERDSSISYFSCSCLMRVGANPVIICKWETKLHRAVRDAAVSRPGGRWSLPLHGFDRLYCPSHGDRVELRVRLLRAEAYGRPLAGVLQRWAHKHS